MSKNFKYSILLAAALIWAIAIVLLGEALNIRNMFIKAVTMGGSVLLIAYIQRKWIE
jgi:hypothetical protein